MAPSLGNAITVTMSGVSASAASTGTTEEGSASVRGALTRTTEAATARRYAIEVLSEVGEERGTARPARQSRWRRVSPKPPAQRRSYSLSGQSGTNRTESRKKPVAPDFRFTIWTEVPRTHK